MRSGLKTSIWTIVLAAVVAGGALLRAQGFNARPGTWQFTITIKGAMPMEGIPPEMQAQIAAQLSKPQVTTSCVTADDLKQLNLGKMDDSDDEACKVLSSRFTATTADITRQCTGDQSYTETAHFEAPSPQVMTGTVSRKAAEGTMTMTLAGKWTAAQCME